MTNNNNKTRKRNLKVGQIILVDSFANVKVKKRLTRRDERGYGWWGVLIDPEDSRALKEKGVPWIEPEELETFTFDFHIVKVIRSSLEKTVDGKHGIRKQKRKSNRGSVRKGS